MQLTASTTSLQQSLSERAARVDQLLEEQRKEKKLLSETQESITALELSRDRQIQLACAPLNKTIEELRQEVARLETATTASLSSSLQENQSLKQQLYSIQLLEVRHPHADTLCLCFIALCTE